MIEPEELKSISAVIEDQSHLDDVVDDLLSSVPEAPKKRVAPVGDAEDLP